MITDYISKNPDWMEYTNFISKKTGERGIELWIDNSRKNRELFRQTGKAWACEDLQDLHTGKTVIMIGASPALAKQINTLREIQQDSDFILFGISCNLKYLLDRGIKPKYIITVDPHFSQGDFWKDVDMAQTKDIVLIANVFAYPDMLKTWQGPIKWIVLASEVDKLQKKIRKWYFPINGIDRGFPALMGQFNTGMALSVLCLGCKIVIFVGNELSYSDKQVTYYIDRKDEKDDVERLPAVDLRGNMVYTSRMLWALKVSSEYFIDAIKPAAWWFNCTEAGIFGVSKRNGNESHIWQLTLKNGIVHARSIMRTGEPFYSYAPSSKMIVPNMREHLTINNLQYVGG